MTSDTPGGWSDSTRPRRRARIPMPSEIASLLKMQGLRAAYDARPPYQRNDYLGWIGRAVRPATRARRIERMVDELRAGEGYMGMAWTPRSSGRSESGMPSREPRRASQRYSEYAGRTRPAFRGRQDSTGVAGCGLRAEVSSPS